jgi:hypothetical protein
MDQNPLNKGRLTENFAGIGVVTRAMVQARAQELALVAGRPARQPSTADYEQARRELTGGPEMDAQETQLDALPESMRWNPVPGSAGHQAPESPSEDEDDEGRSETELLVEEGVNEAERDQMLQAAKETARKDQAEA